MDQLLPEIISYIFRYLSVSDRKEASLVCKKWYYASLDPVLQKNVVFKCQLKDKASIANGLFERKLTHISLDEENSSVVSEETLTNLLLKCSHLRHLDLSFGNSLFLSGQFLSDEDIRNNLKENLRTVTELKLCCLRHITDVTFTRLVSVMEKVDKISVGSNNILFHNNGKSKSTGGAIDSPSVFNFTSFLRFVTSRASLLKDVDLSFTMINDQALEQFSQIPGLCLESLALKGCVELTDKGIKTVAQNQCQLQHLDIGKCQSLGTSKIFFSTIVHNMPKLHTLKARKCPRIGQCDIASLNNMTPLRVIDFSEALNLYESDLIRGLCIRQQSLTAVLLAYCPDVADHFVTTLCKSNPGLRHLDLTSCRKITDVSIRSITRNLSSLQHLCLAYCHQISDLGLLGFESEKGLALTHHFDHDHVACTCTRPKESRIFSPPKGILKEHQSSLDKAQTQLELGKDLFKLSNLTSLKTLDLSSCPKITDLGIIEVIRFQELQNVSLEYLPKLTDKGIGHLVRCNPSLETVSVRGCDELTDMAVNSLCTHCPRLKSLNVAQNDKITNTSIVMVAKCRRLRFLDVSFCGSITYDAVMSLEKSEPQLKFQFRPHIIY